MLFMILSIGEWMTGEKREGNQDNKTSLSSYFHVHPEFYFSKNKNLLLTEREGRTGEY